MMEHWKEINLSKILRILVFFLFCSICCLDNSLSTYSAIFQEVLFPLNATINE